MFSIAGEDGQWQRGWKFPTGYRTLLAIGRDWRPKNDPEELPYNLARQNTLEPLRLDHDQWELSSSANRDGSNQRNTMTAAAAPRISAIMKPTISCGLMPANESVNARAMVTTGFAKSVDVNQKAPPIYAATTPVTDPGRILEQIHMAPSNPNVETNSLNILAKPLLSLTDNEKTGAANMAFATPTPAKAPMNCTGMYARPVRAGKSPLITSAAVTRGLKCAPDNGLNHSISAKSAAAVASELAISATATFPWASRSPRMPEPTTAISKNPVPMPSATSLCIKLKLGEASFETTSHKFEDPITNGAFDDKSGADAHEVIHPGIGG